MEATGDEVSRGDNHRMLFFLTKGRLQLYGEDVPRALLRASQGELLGVATSCD